MTLDLKDLKVEAEIQVLENLPESPTVAIQLRQLGPPEGVRGHT